ncbi:hypothetical protein Ahy_A01g003534 [Arachis hypogaea]|uniref:FAR1 domain-containing protein n=1 Tax=Arachis hypogaea TaxID=3818 RepID=A0A445ET65_ARAHY|nr:hypothetical protein Ahy_A01g003534 [Arachis hypogaea]
MHMGTTNKMCDNDDACQENVSTRNGLKNVDQDTTLNITESDFFYRDIGEFGDVEGIDVEDIIKKVFSSDEDVALELGKGIPRRMRMVLSPGGGSSATGKLDRTRVHKPKTRTNCEAKFSIYFDKSASLWRVRKIDKKHNHKLTPSCMVHLIVKYRSLTDAAKAQINGLNECEISTAKTVRYMARMAGGYSLVSFLKKDSYNHIDKRRCVTIAKGDAKVALAYLEGPHLDANVVVKNFLQLKHTIIELVQNLELMVRDYWNNELLAQFKTIDTFPVMTTSLDAIEWFTALIDTKEVFADIKREIERVAVVNLVRIRISLNTRVYSLEEYESPARAMKEIRELCKDLKCEFRHAKEVNHTKGYQKFIRDPVRVRTKRAPKVSKGKSNGRKRKCTGCRNIEHTKRKC